jgi:hypothetical protein
MKKIWHFFRSIKYGIQNLIKWFPVIWQDRDWDHWFIFKIFHFKLKEVENFQRKYGNSITHEKIADQIKLAVLLLDRLVKDEYLENVLKPHEKKWGDSEMIFTPIKGNEEYSSLDLKVEKANTKEEIDQESKERTRLYDHERKLREQDLDILFKHMRKYIEGWWD